MFPFVIISGHGDEKTAVQMMKEGALDYVMKDAGLLELLPGVVGRAISALDRVRDLERANVERCRLEREILEISEIEKQHFGRELHDGLGQQLTAVAFMSQLLSRSLEKEAPELCERAREIVRQICQAAAQARRLAHGLAPAILEEGGLCEALKELAEFITQSGVTCKFSGKALDCAPGTEITIHLYRIAQEAVTNALKHAKASLIVLNLREGPGGIELTIEDNGQGASWAKQPKDGIGLHVMRYRAKLIGARLEIDSPSAGGVCITCKLPNKTTLQELNVGYADTFSGIT